MKVVKPLMTLERNLMLIMTLCTVAIIFSLVSLNKNINKGNENIGKSIVLKNDTLMITNFSPLKATYTLDNGAEINVTLANKSILNK